MQTLHNREVAVRIAVNRAQALKAQRLIAAAGIDLNLTQAVNALLVKGLKALQIEANND